MTKQSLVRASKFSETYMERVNTLMNVVELLPGWDHVVSLHVDQIAQSLPRFQIQKTKLMPPTPDLERLDEYSDILLRGFSHHGANRTLRGIGDCWVFVYLILVVAKFCICHRAHVTIILVFERGMLWREDR